MARDTETAPMGQMKTVRAIADQTSKAPAPDACKQVDPKGTMPPTSTHK